MKKTSMKFITALALCGSMAAFAGPGMKGPMQAIDADQNGEITKQELDTFQQQHFSKSDTDGDGQISADEFQAAKERMQQERIQKHFERMDKDGNGTLSQEELQSKFQKYFEKCDKNSDDVLSKDELKQCHHGKGKHKGMDKGRSEKPSQSELPPNRNQ